jgi:hypothetical protein
MILTRNPILTPTDNQVRIEAIIKDSTGLLKPNYYGNYEFSFQPLTADDHQRLFEAGESALTDVMYNTPSYACYTLRRHFENKDGTPFCSQRFEPQLNEDVYNPTQLIGRQASLTLHFKDADDGNLYLQCSYVDLYDEDNGFIDYRTLPPQPGERVEDYDW